MYIKTPEELIKAYKTTGYFSSLFSVTVLTMTYNNNFKNFMKISSHITSYRNPNPCDSFTDCVSMDENSSLSTLRGRNRHMLQVDAYGRREHFALGCRNPESVVCKIPVLGFDRHHSQTAELAPVSGYCLLLLKHRNCAIV